MAVRAILNTTIDAVTAQDLEDYLLLDPRKKPVIVNQAISEFLKRNPKNETVNSKVEKV